MAGFHQNRRPASARKRTGALTDLTTYIPVAGVLSKARAVSRLGRLAKGAVIGSAGVAAQELGFQSLQDLRTAEESFMNIGTAALLGGGIGAFSHTVFPDHVLHPAHPDNPLHLDNIDKQGVGIRTPDGDMEVIAPTSLGAAAVPVDAPRALDGLTTNIPGIGRLTEMITGATPVGRALQYTGDQSRELLTKLMDLGGVLTDTNRFGVKTAHSAEDIKRDMLVLRDRVFAFGDKELTDLNQELGQSKTAASFGLTGRVDEVRFSDVARLKLLEEWTDTDAVALASEFGTEAAGYIERHAQAFADRIHATNAEFERELIELGALNPEKSLGQKYGHAQLWDPHSVMARQEEFEDFLYDILARSPDQEWLLSQHGLSSDDFAKLGNEATAVRGERAEASRLITKEEGAALRTSILREWAGDEASFSRTRAELQHEAAQAALKQAELDLADVMHASGLAKAEKQRLSISEARRFRDKFNADLEAARVKRAELEAEQRALAEAATAARSQTLARQQELRPVRREDLKPGESAEAPVAATRTLDVAASQARASTVASELRRVTAQVRRMEKRLAAVDAAYAHAAQRLAAATKTAAALRTSVGGAKVSVKEASRAARTAKRVARRADKKTPLAEAVSDIHRALINRDALPHAILDRNLVETGRVKTRKIRLDPEQRRQAEELGFLRTDLSAILHSQYDQLAGYIGVHKGLDISPTGRFGSWDAVLETVDDEYRSLIRATGNEKQKARLNAERENVRKDLSLLKDRLLGTEYVGADKDGWAYWMSRKVRQANFVRFGAGFLLPSLTDVAAVSLRTGSIGKLLLDRAPEAISIMRGMDRTELREMLYAVEMGMNGPRMARALDAEDALNTMGIGARGSFKHSFTANVDRAGRWLSDKTGILSGMVYWNRFWKITAGIHRAYRLRDLTARYGSLAEKEVVDLASLGIDKEAAERIHRFIQKYGETDSQGRWDPNLDRWTETPDGRTAARDFRIAVERDIDRAVFTPGIGDTPGIMSNAVGKLWLQFQTYAFTFLNRFMIPASQRVATWRDTEALMAYAHLAWSGLIVVVGKDILNGNDPAKRFEKAEWGRTTKEILDRSGMLTYLSPYVDSLLKVSAPLQEKAFGDVKVGPTSRYARNAWLESAFGAAYGLARDVQGFGGALATGDPDKITKKGLVLMPFNSYWRLMHQLSAIDGDKSPESRILSLGGRH